MSSDSDQKSILIDWSVFKNQFFDPIVDFQSYMIDLFIFLWSIFRFFFENEKRPISLLKYKFDWLAMDAV